MPAIVRSTNAVLLFTLAVSCASLPPTGTPPPSSPLLSAPSPTIAVAPTARATPTASPSASVTPPVEWTPPPGPTMLPEDATPPEWIAESELDQIAADVAARLFDAYAGTLPLEEVFTPVALAHARASDPLVDAIAEGDSRVTLEHDVIGKMEHWTRYLPDSTPVRIRLELTVDIAAGATTNDRAGEVVEVVDDPERRTLELTLAWDGSSERWLIDELRSAALGVAIYLPIGTPATAAECPWNAADVPTVNGFDRQIDRPWCDGLNREVPRRHLSFIRSAPRHCEWQSASLLHLGPQPGWEIDHYDPHQFGRDPRGIFRELSSTEYEVVHRLPDGAIDTGLTNGNVRLFYVPDEYDTAIYAVMGDVVERWPRLHPPAACL